MKKQPLLFSRDNYVKTLTRVEKSLSSGRFATYSQQKKQEIWKRLCRYARQLGIKIKTSVAAAFLAAGLYLSNSVTAQPVFTSQPGAANPLNGVNNGFIPAPTFVDIDGDGDKDAFIGLNNGNIVFYRNTGTGSAAVFTAQTGVNNPFNGVSAGINSHPTFVDIDGDGDQDAFIGNASGIILYYKNTGTASVPTFTVQPGAANPLNGVDVGRYATPTFVDIDGDGDKDVFIGEFVSIAYYKNTGTSVAPVFTQQTGAANPFNGLLIGNYLVPTFADIDGDGDLDAIVGEYDGTIDYFQNTGTSSVPVFTEQAGAANPFNGVDVGRYAEPAFVDIDGDGDYDVFVGELYGNSLYYKNTSVGTLPLQLIRFNGSRQAGYNQLQWQTVDEINTKWFELERSNDGINFTRIATINTLGNGNHNYSSNDNLSSNGKLFYRLKMVDVDSRSVYSNIIWLDSNPSGVITIYPNPAKDIISINISSTGLLRTTAGLYDAGGKLLRQFLINNTQEQVNVQPLTAGIYTIKFADGSAQSFIKQ